MITQLATLDLCRLDDIFMRNNFFEWSGSREATNQILADIRETKSLFYFEREARLRQEYDDLNRTIITQDDDEEYESFIARCVELNHKLQLKDQELQTFLIRRATFSSTPRSGNLEEGAPDSPKEKTPAARRAAVLFSIAKTVQ
jgi:hypothetical protein